jgi:hypothetical protein
MNHMGNEFFFEGHSKDTVPRQNGAEGSETTLEET